MASGLFTAGLTVFLARRLGVHSYGLFALGLSIVALVQLLSDFGVAVAIPRFVAEHRNDRVRLRELVADGLAMEAVASLAFGGAIAALAGVIAAAYDAPGLALPLRALAIALVGGKFLLFCLGVFAAMRRQMLNVWANLIESAAEVSASVLLVLLAGGAAAAAFGRAAGFLIGAVAALWLANRLLDGGIRPRSFSSHGHMRKIGRYSSTLWIVDGIYTTFMQIDSLLIGGLLAAGSVAFFQAPLRLTVMLQYPGSAIAAAAAPRLVRSGRVRPDVRVFSHSVRLVIILMAPLAVLTTVWARPIIHYTLGAGYGRAADVLMVLAPYVFLCGAAELVSSSLNYLGRAPFRIPIAVTTLLVNLGLDLLLIPRLGVVGGAIGSDVGIAIYVLGHFALCVSALHLRIRPFVVTLMRCAAATVPMVGVLVAVGVGGVSPVALVLGGAAGTAVYALGLLVSGEISPRDLRRWLQRLRAQRLNPQRVTPPSVSVDPGHELT